MEALILPHLTFCACGHPGDGGKECRNCREMNAARAMRQQDERPIGMPHTVSKAAVAGERYHQKKKAAQK